METETFGNNDAHAHVHFLIGSSKSTYPSLICHTPITWGKSLFTLFSTLLQQQLLELSATISVGMQSNPSV